MPRRRLADGDHCARRWHVGVAILATGAHVESTVLLPATPRSRSCARSSTGGPEATTATSRVADGAWHPWHPWPEEEIEGGKRGHPRGDPRYAERGRGELGLGPGAP